jgi:hypothetical protein
MVWLVLLSPFVLLAVGIPAAKLAYRRTGSVLLSSAVFTLLFSFGLGIYRIALPMPTLVLLGMAAYAAMAPKAPCVPTPEGCYSEADEASIIIVLPFLVQWAFWFLVFGLGRYVSSRLKRAA